RDRVLVLDQLTELGVALVADRRLERDRQAAIRPDLLDPLRRDRRLRIDRQDLRGLGDRRLAAEAYRPLPGDAGDAVHRLDHVDRDPDRPALVREATLDRLADPPRRVGRELEATLPLELVDAAHQPGVALLDEVQEAHAAVDVLLRIGDDEPEV